MADQGTIDVIREALAESGGVELDRLELVLDGGAVVLQGAVSAPEQVSLAAMVAEQHTEEVRNQLRVDPGLRENPADHTAVAPDDPAPDVSEALGENESWDPPDHPQAAL